MLILLAISTTIGLGSPVHAETHYIPVVNLSQRYDSNIFYFPKEFLPPDAQQWDFVTSLSAGLKVLNTSRLGNTEFQGFVNGNVYAHNTNLSYASTYLNGSTDVSSWIQELLPNAQLRLSDRFLYTPEPPAFLTGGKIGETDLLARGIQGYRANTFSNRLSAEGGYSISRSVGLKTTYAYSVRRTGTAFVPGTPFTFFDTTAHDVAAGPTYRFDNGDTLFVRYNYMASASDPSEAASGQPSFTFTAHTLQPEYIAAIVRGWTATISGGATLVEEAQNKTFFSGRFALTNDFDRRTRASISVSRQATPAYFGTGGALISNVAQAYLSHNLSRVIILTVSGNYALNESTTGPTFRIETIYGSAVLDYNLTRSTKVSLSQEYGTYNITDTPNFDRYATTLTLTTEWK
jgi:hypothetical protein